MKVLTRMGVGYLGMDGLWGVEVGIRSYGFVCSPLVREWSV